MHILYAEDSMDIAQPVMLVLQADGHQVRHVTDGKAALAAYQAELPDMVLLDVVMTNMDGIEACRQIRAIPVSKWIPVILLSAQDRNEDMIEGLEAGADEYLTKPIDLKVLIARMRSKQRTVDIQNIYYSILDNVNEGIITIDDKGIVSNFNHAAELIFSYQSSEVLGKNVKMLMPEPYQSEHDGYLANYLRTFQPKVIGTGKIVEGRRKDGTIFPMQLAVTRVDSAFGMLFIGVVRDISREVEDRRKIEFMAMHDTLTGLPNRADFMHHLTEHIKAKIPFTLLYIDIDGFKLINDTFGHKVGDMVLIAIAHRLNSAVSSSDIVARLGGDEFVVILHGINTVDIFSRIAQRIIDKLGMPMRLEGEDCQVGASIGAAIFPDHGMMEEKILAAADKAMYDAKHAGKNRLVVYS